VPGVASPSVVVPPSAVVLAPDAGRVDAGRIGAGRIGAGRGWVHGPVVDVLLAFAWVPFAGAAFLARNAPGSLTTVVSATLLVSLVHQPLTLGLVYGDAEQFALRRRIFTWAPVVLVAAVLFGRWWNPALVASVAGLWNAEHTLMQRYGLVRIYGRKAGEANRTDERPMLISWLVLALVWAAADPRTPKLLTKVEIGATNERGVRLLHRLAPGARVFLPVVVVGVVALAWRWWRLERRQASRSVPKRVYLASSALLFVMMLVAPIVGLMGYVGAHAVEYIVVVRSSLGRRYGDSASTAPVARAVRSPLGPTGLTVVYLVGVAALLLWLKRVGSIDLYATVFLTVGGLHILYDGFIWKLRRPAVANSFAIGSPAG
jgi:hypothetical protein